VKSIFQVFLKGITMSNSQDQSKVSGTEVPKAPAPAAAPQQGQSAPKPASDKPNEQQK
jgi:hypothetical protein